MIRIALSRKSQAAMEFLTTYGWALLVAVVVIGALAYFGVLSPGKFVPDSCRITGALSCAAMNINHDDKQIDLLLQNNKGKVISLDEVSAKGDPESDSKGIECEMYACQPGSELCPSKNIRAGASGRILLDCSSSPKPIHRGDVVDIVVNVKYRFKASGQTASVSGPVHFRVN